MKNSLKDLRLQKGMTQEQLAQAVGTSKAYISQLENGNRNIETIRQATMSRLCAALGCSPEDLIIPVEFEYDEDGKLIVDSVWHDSHFPTGYLAIIGKAAFLIPMGRMYESGEQMVKAMRPLPYYVFDPKNRGMHRVPNYEYLFLKCVPRKGFDIKLGRPICPEELAELREEYNITDDDISNPFLTTIGAIYGKKYMKNYTCVQVRVPEMEAIPLERKLRDRGIEAGNIAPGRVNIRIEEEEKEC